MVIQRLFATGLQLQGVRPDGRPGRRGSAGAGRDDLDLTIKDIRGTIFELQDRWVGRPRPRYFAAWPASMFLPLGFSTDGADQRAYRHGGPGRRARGGAPAPCGARPFRTWPGTHGRVPAYIEAQVRGLRGGRLFLSVADDGIGLPRAWTESGLANNVPRLVAPSTWAAFARGCPTPGDPVGTVLAPAVRLGSVRNDVRTRRGRRPIGPPASCDVLAEEGCARQTTSGTTSGRAHVSPALSGRGRPG